MESTPAFDLIKTKRAVRQFKDEPLPDDVVHRIVEAGRLSGSAKNMQPWQFIVVQSREKLRGLSECGQFARHLASAALGIALVFENPMIRLSVPFDLGRATQNMMLTAWEQGVGSVMATIYRPDRARAILNVPDTHTIPWCVSFGYPADDAQRPPRKGGRQVAREVIHYEQW